jgi:hypothetical protein
VPLVYHDCGPVSCRRYLCGWSDSSRGEQMAHPEAVVLQLLARMIPAAILAFWCRVPGGLADNRIQAETATADVR